MEKRIIDFIAEAKKQAYASDKIKPKKTKDGRKTYSLKKGDLLYTDTYFGSMLDCGQERVYLKGKVIWIMAYRGGIYDRYQLLHEKAFEFLKKCISEIPKNFPARGPRSMKLGNFRYENKWEGNIKGFVGRENIYYQGKKICFRNYLGGLIKDR